MNIDSSFSPGVAATIMVAFALAWISLGLYWSKHTEGTKHYLFAGRNVGLALITTTLMATWVTGSTVLAAPEQTYLLGVWGMLGYAFAGFGLIGFAPLAVRIRRLMPYGFTSGDFIRLRFGLPSWGVFMFISAFYFLGFLITTGMGAGLLLEALSGIDYHVGMVTVLIVTTIYTLLGGMRAVVGMDFIQAMLIMIGLVVVAVMAYSHYGIGDVYTGVLENNPKYLNLLLPAGLLYAWNTGLMSMGEVFHSNIWWMRAYASRPKVNFRGFIISGIAWMTVPLVTGSITLIAVAFPDEFNIPQVNMVLPIVSAKVLGPVGAALIFIIVFAALASTASGLLTATATLIAQDFYRQFINPSVSDEKMKKVVRILIATLCLITIALSWKYVTSMYGLLLLTGALVGSTVWPIACGLYWEKTNPIAALTGMIVGSSCGLAFYFAISSFAAAIIGFILSGLIIVVGTAIRPRAFDWKTLAESPLPKVSNDSEVEK